MVESANMVRRPWENRSNTALVPIAATKGSGIDGSIALFFFFFRYNRRARHPHQEEEDDPTSENDRDHANKGHEGRDGMESTIRDTGPVCETTSSRKTQIGQSGSHLEGPSDSQTVVAATKNRLS